MFILSIKSLKSKILIISISLISIITAIFLIFNMNKQKNIAISETGKYNLTAKNNDERVKFFSQFGWEVSPKPIEICDIIIPSNFNSVFENYNNIQKSQGLDLSKYKEQSCTRYTYQVLNYEDAACGIRANILVLNNRVIAGDICSNELNGFMHGFVAPENNKPAYNSNTSTNVNTVPEHKGFQNEPIKSTFRENLNPDPKNPSAPTD